MLILATGPSAWAMLDIPIFSRLLQQMPILAINRGMNLGLKPTYQISLDAIWSAFFNLRSPVGSVANQRHQHLRRQFRTWQDKYKTYEWTLEEFVAAYHKELNLHPEIKCYFRLLSPHAPFTRFLPDYHAVKAPYTAVHFTKNREKILHGVYNGLFIANQTGVTAIHLASVMGADPIFLAGIDLEKPDGRLRVWERCVYRRDGVIRQYSKIATALYSSTNIINLNPKSKLETFYRCKSLDESLAQIKKALEK